MSKPSSWVEINLPPPLSEKEEKELLEKISSSDAKKILQERNLRLVFHVAKKFSNANYSIEDLFSIGTIGLIKAVNSFNPKKGVKLATYAARCIDNEILMYLRYEHKWKTNVNYMQDILATDSDGHEFHLEDVIADEKDSLCSEVLEKRDLISSLITVALHRLSQKEIIIFFYRLGEKTQKEIAGIMGISQSYISRIEKKIILKLKNFESKTIEKKEIHFYLDEENYYLEFSKETYDNISEIANNFSINYQDIGSAIKLKIPSHDSLLIADFLKTLYNY